MAIKPLSLEEIKKMRAACQLAAQTLLYIEKYVKPGVTTNELNQLVHDYTLTHNAIPAPLGYHGFPKSLCTSVNQVVCHGLPDETVLKVGDIINVDVTSIKDGFFGDTSKTFMVGEVSPQAFDIVEAAKLAMEKGIEAITPNGRTGDIGFEIHKFATRKGYSTVKDIGGHGIGRTFHDEPFVPAHGKKGKGERLVPFHCITVEPMLNQGTDQLVEVAIPGSSIKYYKTADGLLSAQFEHTVLVTDKGYEILTLP
ncbi:MAG: type I methionyl aminopeptidase [Pseudobdellovibrionaceae bacterium]